MEKDPRGFNVYAYFKDHYGAGVTVKESSTAQVEGDPAGPWLWVFVDGGSITGNSGSSHMEPKHARMLRDALDAWLESVDEEEKPAPHPVWDPKHVGPCAMCDKEPCHCRFGPYRPGP